MDTEHLQELIQLEHHYWWHVAKRQLVLSWLSAHAPPPACVIEGGIGGATNLQHLWRLGYQVTGLDILPESIERAWQLGIARAYRHDLLQAWPVDAQSQDVVLLLDVLEHLEDPVLALRNAAASLRPGGWILLTVPAYPWLYGDWDRRLGHFRRYTARMLRHQAQQAGLAVAWLNYWNAFSLPAAIAVRLYQRFLPGERPATFPRVHSLTNQTLLTMAGVERWCCHRFPLPCGLSLISVLQSPVPSSTATRVPQTANHQSACSCLTPTPH